MDFRHCHFHDQLWRIDRIHVRKPVSYFTLCGPDGRTKNMKDIFSCGDSNARLPQHLRHGWKLKKPYKYVMVWAMLGILYLGYKPKALSTPRCKDNEFDDTHH